MSEVVIDTLVTELKVRSDDATIKRAEKALEQLEEQARETAKATDGLARRQLELRERALSASQSAARLREQQKQLNAEIKAGGEVGGRLTAQLRATESEYHRVTQEAAKYRAELARLGLEQQRVAAQQRATGAGRRELGGAVQDARSRTIMGALEQGGGSIGGTVSALSKASPTLAAAAPALGAIGVAAVAARKGYGELNEEMARMDDIAKRSQRSGLGAEEYQRLSHAAQLTGTDIEQVGKSVRKVNVQLATVAQGGGAEFVKTLGAIGLTADDLKGKGATEQIATVAEALKGVKDEGQKAAIAARIFGEEAGPALMPLLNAGASGIRDMTGELKHVFSNEDLKRAEAYMDSQTRMHHALAMVKGELALAFAPAVQGAVDALTSFVDNNREGIDALIGFVGTGLKPAALAIKVLILPLKTVVEWGLKFYDLLGDLATGLSDLASEAADAAGEWEWVQSIADGFDRIAGAAAGAVDAIKDFLLQWEPIRALARSLGLIGGEGGDLEDILGEKTYKEAGLGGEQQGGKAGTPEAPTGEKGLLQGLEGMGNVLLQAGERMGADAGRRLGAAGQKVVGVATKAIKKGKGKGKGKGKEEKPKDSDVFKGLKEAAGVQADRMYAKAVRSGEAGKTNAEHLAYRKKAYEDVLGRYTKNYEETGALPWGVQSDIAQMSRLPGEADIAGRTAAPVISVVNKVTILRDNQFTATVEGGTFGGTPEGFAQSSLSAMRKLIEQMLGDSYSDFRSPEVV